MEEDDEDLYTIDNHYAVYSFYDDLKCLTRGEIYIQLQIDGEFRELTDKVSDVANVLKISPEELRDKMNSGSDKEKLCKQIFDQLIVIKTLTNASVNPDDNIPPIVDYRLILDPKIQSMSDVISQIKR